jgi:hypothetical protein
MSQSVQLDMEVLQRFKFLMEYDVMKTSSENILLEQSTDLQKLAKEKGFGPVSLSKAQELYNQGKLGNSFDIQGNPDYTTGQAKVMASKYPAVQKANKEKSGTIDVARTDVSRMYSQPSKEVKEMRLDELTLKVREIMLRWEVATAETFMTVLGVGIPIVIGANGLWFTLEVAQVLKGTPDWLNLTFSFLSLATAGSQSAVLKPLYSSVAKSLGGKGRSLINVLDEIFKKSKELGLWDKLKPILDGISKFTDNILSLVGKTWKWLKDNVFWIFKGVTWAGELTISALINFVSKLINTFDSWVKQIGTKVGLNPEKASKLGPAVRWGTGVGVVARKLQPDSTQQAVDDITDVPYTYKPGTFAGDVEQKKNR